MVTSKSKVMTLLPKHTVGKHPWKGLLLASLAISASLHTASALTCILCNALTTDNEECWSPSSPPKKVTQCGTGACRSHLVYLGPDSHSKGLSARLSILRECAEFGDEGRGDFLEKMKGWKNATGGPKVYCVTDHVPCSRDCYCSEDLCNNWTTDKVAQADQRVFGEDIDHKANMLNCNPVFNKTFSETVAATTPLVGTAGCPFLANVLGVIIAIQLVWPIHLT